MFVNLRAGEGGHGLVRSYTSDSSVRHPVIAISGHKLPRPTHRGVQPRTLPQPPAHPGPSLIGVPMDAFSRLQTQTQNNAAGLEIQRRSYETLTQTVARLSNDMARIDNLVASFRRELQARRTVSLAPPTPVSQVDSMRVQLENFKRQVRIMEELIPTTVGPFTVAAPLHSTSSVASSRARSQTNLSHPPQHAPRLNRSPSLPSPQQQTPSPYASVSNSPQARRISTPECQPNQHSASNGSGSADASAKRHSESIDNPTDAQLETSGSLKRQKLAHLELRARPECTPALLPIRDVLKKANSRDHRAEATGERLRHTASAPANFVRCTDEIEDPQDSRTVRHGPRGNSQVARRLHGSTKTTRWRPTRNADGVLLRKDGTPDMRSRANRMRILQGQAPGSFP